MRFLALLLLATGCNAIFGFDESKLKLVDASTTPGDGPPMVDAMTDAMPIDAEPPDAFAGPCDPLNQTGCGGGEKCTWITIDSANGIGDVGCVPDGTIAIAGACTRGADGMTTGFDDCVGGTYCVSGQCEAICNTSPDSCPATGKCTMYSGVFPSGSNVGMCDFTCDPVTQRRLIDNATSCGAISPAVKGCYKIDEGKAICATTPSAAQTQTQDETAYNWPSAVFINGCAPGFQGLLRSDTQPTSPIICVAFCRPAETYVGNTANAGGQVGSGYTCADRGASGQECHFFHFVEDPANPADNGIGFCWKPENYVGDWDNDPGTADTGYPRCSTLSNTDTDGDSIPQHIEYGCAPIP